MASIQYVVNATDAASSVFAKIGLSADNLDRQLQDLSKRVATPEVDLEDSKFTLGVIKAAERLDKLSAKIADPKIDVDAGAAQVEILRINAMLDRLDAKRVSVSVDVDRRGGLLSRLGGMFGGGSGPEGLGTGIAGLGQGGPIALGVGAALAASLAPALLPLGLGALVGGGGALGGLMLGSQSRQKLLQLQKSLRSVTGSTASSNARRALLRSQIDQLRDTQGTQLALGAAGAGLQHSLLGTFLGALTGTGAGFSGGAPGGTQNASFLTGLTGILKQIGAFIKSIGPQLGDMFRASLPFLQAFVKVMEQFARAVLPSMTQSLKLLAPDLPIITQGFKYLSEGIAGFIKNLGPGMKDSAIIFKAAMMVTKGMLQLVGAAASDLAIGFVKTAEGIRAFARGVPPFFDKMRHDIANIFDGIRHDVAHYWDVIYNNTIGAVLRIDRGILGFFDRLPGQIVRALAGLGTTLWNLGSTWMTRMWNGIKSVWDHVIGFFRNIPGDILHALGIHSPPDWAIEAGKHIMDGLHIGLAGTFGKITSFFSGIPRGLGAGLKGAPEGIAAAMLPAFGWSPAQMAPLVQLWNRESGWRWNARNPTSGAYGIPQALPASKMAAAGPDWLTNPATQIRWGLSYIKGRYGTPAGAWAHELQFGWYDRGGWLPPGLSLALNNTGAPERVGGGPGNTYNITVNVPPSANKADVGRQVVETIREYERRSGNGWRK